jgi:hypothetical protein
VTALLGAAVATGRTVGFSDAGGVAEAPARDVAVGVAVAEPGDPGIVDSAPDAAARGRPLAPAEPAAATLGSGACCPVGTGPDETGSLPHPASTTTRTAISIRRGTHHRPPTIEA